MLDLVDKTHDTWKLSRCYIARRANDNGLIAKVEQIDTWVAGKTLATDKTLNTRIADRLKTQKEEQENNFNKIYDPIKIAKDFNLVIPDQATMTIIAATTPVAKSDHKPTFFKTWAPKMRHIVVSKMPATKNSKPVFRFQYFENKAAKKGVFTRNEHMFMFELPHNGAPFGTYKAPEGAKGANGAKPLLAAQGASCDKFLSENSKNLFIDEQASRASKQ